MMHCIVRFAQGNNGYDIIIVDSSDPVGPAETLFQPTFYQVSFIVWRCCQIERGRKIVQEVLNV